MGVAYNMYNIGNVGDSKAVLYKSGLNCVQLTKDHTAANV